MRLPCRLGSPPRMPWPGSSGVRPHSYVARPLVWAGLRTVAAAGVAGAVVAAVAVLAVEHTIALYGVII